MPSVTVDAGLLASLSYSVACFAAVKQSEQLTYSATSDDLSIGSVGAIATEAVSGLSVSLKPKAPSTKGDVLSLNVRAAYLVFCDLLRVLIE
jgi:hypothetical protein